MPQQKNKINFFALAILLTGILLFPASTFSQTAAHNETGGNADAEIQDLQNQITEKQKNLEELQKRQAEYQEQIRSAQNEQATLKNQIAILNANINKTEAQLQETQVSIDKTALEIKKVTLEIAAKEADIAQKRQYLESLLRLMAQNDDKDALEILFTNQSLSDFLEQVQYLQSLNQDMGTVLEKVKETKADLESQQTALEKKKSELEGLKEKLAGQKAEVADQKQGTQYILDKTRQSERNYQQLLSSAKAEQEAANAAIVSAEKAIRQKMAEQNGQGSLQFNDKGFIWPVSKNTVTAYFHDPSYPFRAIFEHPAVDIRAGQGTPIRAAASGYVARAHDGGYGYSYIMIVHGDGLSTVYGHVSRIDVSIDQYVVQGQVIGLSGATPGTPGAGPLTTGPHLHFETRLNGIPVNPLNYLP
ncbi:hypothetical protein A2242_01915 [Candidatus Falkowbacteria bacterium RIFOXYA2_FULL_47_9]|uniref:M23ase beta-sheet core domain-containing protein n=1 Tax=Candidatus Falkowbacteria bacterium RIFOXYA2_FULL_47_9 TaxID=1797995 RepID=A0A1F5SJ40_9BACT|nr:MAG: hypothetical protein A2242_01915 [Candidatus Falkowbacteria bacterium RIFOXYA2_FULL_47_9]